MWCARIGIGYREIWSRIRVDFLGQHASWLFALNNSSKKRVDPKFVISWGQRKKNEWPKPDA